MEVDFNVKIYRVMPTVVLKAVKSDGITVIYNTYVNSGPNFRLTERTTSTSRFHTHSDISTNAST